MNNGIRERQNKEENLAYLAAQKQIYIEAKKLNAVICVCSVFVPFSFSVASYFIKNIETVSYLAVLFSWGVGFALSWCAEKSQKNAACIQQKFDLDVFQMTWDQNLFGQERDVSDIAAEKSEKRFRDPLERKKLSDWYEQVEDSMELNQAILLCQKQNNIWDTRLRKRYRMCSGIVIGVLAFVILVIGIISNETLEKVLLKAAFALPLLQWEANTFQTLKRDIKRLDRIGSLIRSPGEKSMAELQVIQHVIYIHRESCYMIPELFYNLFKKKDRKMLDRQVKLGG